MATSSTATAGTNATSTQYNDLRTDAITRYIRAVFEIPGSLAVANDQQVLPIPATMTITKIKHRVESGSCTLRIQKDTSDVKAGMSVGTSYTNETSGLTNTSAVEGEELRLDLTAVSSASGLHVIVYMTETI